MEFVAYYRVSTDRQGTSGLGLAAQRQRVAQLAADRGATVVAEFEEWESGRKNNREQLAAALVEARKRNAVIVVAKLDRMARDAEFLLRLTNEANANGIGGFLFCDLPEIDATTAAGRMILTVMASVAEFESRRISERTKEAIAAAKARNPELKIGGKNAGTEQANAQRLKDANDTAETYREVLTGYVASGMSLKAMAASLQTHKVKTPTGRDSWAPTQVSRLLKRLQLR